MTTLWRRVGLEGKETNKGTIAVTKTRNKDSNKPMVTKRKRRYWILERNHRQNQWDQENHSICLLLLNERVPRSLSR